MWNMFSSLSYVLFFLHFLLTQFDPCHMRSMKCETALMRLGSLGSKLGFFSTMNS